MQFVDALVCSAPGELRIERRPTPKPEPRCALVKPRRIGICGTDYHIYEGKHPYLQYPRVIGHELAVEVVEAPEDSGFAAGETCIVNPYLSCGHCVACRMGKPNCCVNISVLGVHQDGGMTELLSLPATNLLHAKGLTADQCASVEFMAIGAHAVRRGAVSARDKALVVGAGPIGLGVALFASLTGGAVAVSDRDAARTKIAESVAGVAVLPADDDVAKTAREFTNGDGFDVVFDATGSARSMEAGFDFVAHGGRYVIVSVVLDTITFADADFHRKEMTLLGTRNATNEDFEQVIAAIRNGAVPVDRLITHRATLAGAVHDIPLWATMKSGLIKALIEVE
jgi:2-desacetyl-2-hydroxyethyl bacteriochlorophyllide A dehydrogenase